MPIIPALVGWRQEDWEFETSLGLKCETILNKQSKMQGWEAHLRLGIVPNLNKQSKVCFMI